MTLPTPTSGSPGAAATPKKPSVLVPKRVRPAAITVGAFGAVLVIVQIVNMIMSNQLATDGGIRPRTLGGLWGVLDAPLLHGGWWHLLSNLVPLLIFGFLILVGGVRQFVAVTVLVWLISGFGVWLTAPSGSVTIGASALVFGWLTYLVLRGFFTRHFAQIALGIVLLLLWGGVFWGLLPGREGISWQGHLFGALGGALAAFLVAKADGPRRPARAAAAKVA